MMKKDALLDDFSAICAEVLAKYFSIQVMGEPRAISEYGVDYKMFKLLMGDLRQDRDTKFDTAIMCDALRGALEGWCQRIGDNTAKPVLIIRTMPHVDAYPDFGANVDLVKVRFRAHAVTQKEFERGPVTSGGETHAAEAKSVVRGTE